MRNGKATGSCELSRWLARDKGRRCDSLRGGRMEICCNLNTVHILLISFCVFVCIVLYIDDHSFQGQVVLGNQSSFEKLCRVAYNRGSLLRQIRAKRFYVIKGSNVECIKLRADFVAAY
jgi:hypothetical protein